MTRKPQRQIDRVLAKQRKAKRERQAAHRYAFVWVTDEQDERDARERREYERDMDAVLYM